MLTVGVVALLQPEYTALCLERIVQSTLFKQNKLKLIIVLNGALQEVIEVVRDFEKSNPVTVIQNPQNIGYAQACNQILQQTTTKYVCFVHNDVVVSSKTFEQMVFHAETTGPEAVAFFPLTNYANEHLCCVKEIREAFSFVKPPNKLLITKKQLLDSFKHLYGDLEDFADDLAVQNAKDPLYLCTEIASYCCMFKKTELRKIGAFCSDFVLRGYEDKELLLRLHEARYQTVLCRTAFVHHHGNLTTDGEGFSYPQLIASQEKIYLRVFEHTKTIKRSDPFAPRPLVSSLTPAFTRAVKTLKTKPKRLLYFGSNYLPENAGGAELSAHETHKRLIEAGVEVCAFCIRDRNHKRFSVLKTFDYEGVKVFQVPERSVPDVQAKLGVVLEQFQPQAILTHSLHALFALELALAEFPNIKRLFFFRHQTDILDGNLARFLETDGGTELISNSSWMQQVLRELTGRDSSVVLPVILPKSCLVPVADRQRRAIVIGNGVLSKGIREFISIAESLPEYPFQVWGSLDPKITMLPPNVEVKNWTQDLKEIYKEAKVVMNLSVDPEPFGRTLIEAMHNRIPVIAHDEGGPKGFIKEGGVLISETVDPVPIIRRMFEDAEYYQKLCEGTVQDLIFYNPYRENAKFLSLIQRALGEDLLRGCAF
jgi:GT2 family glycosyltransferase